VRAIIRCIAVPLVLSAAAGCSPPVDITRAVRLEGISTGWYEASGDAGQIKLVPAISFKLRNVSNDTLRTLQVNAIFKRVTEDTEWGSDFRTVVGSTGLYPADTTGRVFVKSGLGYVGSESKFDMLKNSQFVDAHVEIYAKSMAGAWTTVGRYPIVRQFIEPSSP